MKAYERFLKSCEPSELLDFYNDNKDTQLLQDIIKQGWETKLWIFKILKEAGYGYNGFKKGSTK